MPATAGAAKAGFPWLSLALGGSSIVESILGKLLFGPPKSVRRLTKQVAAKGSELITNPGYGPDVISAIFGKNFENIRGQGKNVRQATTESFGRAGMLGTGAELAATRKNAWQNENLVTEAMRDLLISGEAKKSSDIALATQMLGQATGSAQAMQGEGPALTEMLLNAVLMGQRNKGALRDQDWQEMFDLYGGVESRGEFQGVLPTWMQPGAGPRTNF